MAIEFARVRYLARSKGQNACRSAAYNARADIHCDRTGERFYFAHREPTLHHEVMLPEGADPKFRDPATLWNAAQTAEKRKDAQEAKELLLALPSDPELGLEDWRELTRAFVAEHFVGKGLAAQIDIHAPHDGDINVHAHILVTTRRIEGNRLSTHKARDLEPEVRSLKGRQIVTEAEAWNILWREHQNRYFERIGLELRVDETGFVPQRHEGPVRLRTIPAESKARLEATRALNAEAARDPVQVLAKVTEQRATFTELDIERILRKHIWNIAERREIRKGILARPEVMALYDQATGSFANRFTTRAVRAEELEVLDAAKTIARHRRPVEDHAQQQLQPQVAEKYRLDEQQQVAYLKATGTDGLVVIEGLAGTGKSHSLSAIRAAHEHAGWRVVGLAPTNVVAESLRASGFKHGSTAHLELYWQDARRYDRVPQWDRRTAVIVDEAAMMDTRVYARIFRLAAETGAKVILAGDDRQLSSVSRGGMFTELKRRHGSAIISKVRRQREDWQRTASEDFAEGRIAEGLRAYAERGHVHWSTVLDESRARLLSDWDHDSRERPETNRFIYASTNAEVNRLNHAIHGIRVARNEIKDELDVETVKGDLSIGTGERIQFHGNDRRRGIFNGGIGTITAIDGHEITVKTDTGRTLSFDARTFHEYGFGYAGTVYRGQGKTQTEVYALYDNAYAWNARTAYVGLTRHTNRVELYVSRDRAEDELTLGLHMAQRLHEEASLAWATASEIKRDERSKGDTSRTEGHAFRVPENDLRKLDLTAFAHDVHGYEVRPDPIHRDHFDLLRASQSAMERLEARKDRHGNWHWRNAGMPSQTGDIFDLAVHNGAPDLAAAREAVAAYEAAMRDPERHRRAAEAKTRPEFANDDPERALKETGTEADRARDFAGAEYLDRLDAIANNEEWHLAYARAETERVSRLQREAEEVRDDEQRGLAELDPQRGTQAEAWLDEHKTLVQQARVPRTDAAPSVNVPATGAPVPAQLRYFEALAEHYDPRTPYASLAKASLAEAAAFQRDQHDLNQRIAIEADPDRHEALVLRRNIEHAEHMAQAYGRVTGIARATGAKDQAEHEQRAASYRNQATAARALWRERGQEQPALYPSLTPERTIPEPVKERASERNLQQEREAMQRLNLPEYAAKHHDYAIAWSNKEQTRAILTKGDEALRASRGKDGAWSYESRTVANDRGDILDFVARRGARTTTTARDEVRPELERVEQKLGRLDPAPERERGLDHSRSRDDDDGPERDPERKRRQ